MKNDLTELVFVLDMSGSMFPLTSDTLGGFNRVLQEQKSGNGEVLVTTYVFNQDCMMLHDRVPIAEVKEMTEEDYRASGSTALVDALGTAIHHIAGIHRYARKEDVPEHTIFVITTDGMENASHLYSAKEVRSMVEHEQEKYGWEFIFLAANIDAVETAGNYGIRQSRAVNFHSDSRGVEEAYNTMNCAVSQKRMRRSLDQEDWRRSADKDFKSR